MNRIPSRITFITLGVSHLEDMKTWYNEKFGWKPFKDEDGIVFYRLNGFVLGLFPKEELAKDIGVPEPGEGFKRFTLAINMNSEKEVDTVFAFFKDNGVTIVKAPEKVFWGGYRGYISDPENNYWEIAYNPFLELDAEGNISAE